MSSATLSKRVHDAARVRNRLRRMLADTPRARVRAELQYGNRRAAHRNHLPGASVDDGLLAVLQRDGVVATTARELGLAEVVDAAQPLVAELLDGLPGAGEPASHLMPRLATAPQIYRWGVGDRIMDLLERYFEVPIAYHGVYLRHDRAGKRVSASNSWHLDMEDRKVVKVIVYLTDVEDGDGAFQHVPLSRSLELRASLGMVYKLGGDSHMARFVPEDEWRTASGPAGTVLICDTARLFHRGRRPENRDRVTLFYDYTSRHPLHPYYCKSALPRRHLEMLTRHMSARARDAVFWRPRLTEFDPVKHE